MGKEGIKDMSANVVRERGEKTVPGSCASFCSKRGTNWGDKRAARRRGRRDGGGAYNKKMGSFVEVCCVHAYGSGSAVIADRL